MPIWLSLIRILLMWNNTVQAINNSQPRINQYFESTANHTVNPTVNPTPNGPTLLNGEPEYIQDAENPYRIKMDKNGDLLLYLPDRSDPVKEKYIVSTLAHWLVHKQNEKEDKEKRAREHDECSDISMDDDLCELESEEDEPPVNPKLINHLNSFQLRSNANINKNGQYSYSNVITSNINASNTNRNTSNTNGIASNSNGIMSNISNINRNTSNTNGIASNSNGIMSNISNINGIASNSNGIMSNISNTNGIASNSNGIMSNISNINGQHSYSNNIISNSNTSTAYIPASYSNDIISNRNTSTAYIPSTNQSTTNLNRSHLIHSTVPYNPTTANNISSNVFTPTTDIPTYPSSLIDSNYQHLFYPFNTTQNEPITNISKKVNNNGTNTATTRNVSNIRSIATSPQYIPSTISTVSPQKQSTSLPIHNIAPSTSNIQSTLPQLSAIPSSSNIPSISPSVQFVSPPTPQIEPITSVSPQKSYLPQPISNIPSKKPTKPPDPPKPPPPSTATCSLNTPSIKTQITDVAIFADNNKANNYLTKIQSNLLEIERVCRLQKKHGWDPNNDRDFETEIDDMTTRVMCKYPQLALLPRSSMLQYIREFKQFINWMDAHKFVVTNFDELTSTVFVQGLTLHYAFKSCWSKYSRIKGCVRAFCDIECEGWIKPQRILKYYEKAQRAKGNAPKQAPMFGWDDLFAYMLMEDDGMHINKQCMAICCAHARIRGGEMKNLNHKNVDKTVDGQLRFEYNKSKSMIKHTFYVIGDLFVAKLIKYFDITQHLWKQPGPDQGALFWSLKVDGQGRVEHINKIPSDDWYYSVFCREIAFFLGYKNWNDFTLHSIPHTVTTLMANSGLSLPHLMRWGGWKSSTVPMTYIHNNEVNKKLYAKIFCNGDINQITNQISTILPISGSSEQSISSSSSITEQNIPSLPFASITKQNESSLSLSLSLQQNINNTSSGINGPNFGQQAVNNNIGRNMNVSSPTNHHKKKKSKKEKKKRKKRNHSIAFQDDITEIDNNNNNKKMHINHHHYYKCQF